MPRLGASVSLSLAPLSIAPSAAAGLAAQAPGEEALQDHVPVDAFTAPDGLEVTLWATSPLLFNPTNLDVDHRSRSSTRSSCR